MSKKCCRKPTRKEKERYLLLLREKRKRELEHSFYEFVKESFEEINKDEEFVDNWHIKYICDEIQEAVMRVIRKEPKKKDIIINVPPRSLKSFIVSVALPVWSWLHNPALKYFGSSYSDTISTEMNLKSRRIINSVFFKKYWPGKITLTGDQNLKTFFENDKGGFRRSTSTGGTIMGAGADIILVDDPQNPKLAASEVSRKNVIDFFDFTLSTRLNNPKTGLYIIIMQRLHEKDLTGHRLSKSPEKYKHICIPGKLTDDVKPESLRKHYANDLFFEKRFDSNYYVEIKKQLGSYQYAGQILQRSAPEEGGLLKRNWWRKYTDLPKLEMRIMSIDAAFKDHDESDYVVIQEWGKCGADKYLIKQYRGRWDFKKTLEKIVLVNKTNIVEKKYINAWYVEAKANGDAIISMIKKKIHGVKEINPTESKYARAMATQPQLEVGNIYVPDPKKYGWVDDFIDECANFPNASNDDQVDAYSQAINELSKLETKSDVFDSMSKY